MNTTDSATPQARTQDVVWSGWRPMTEAPAGDVSAVIDIWDGERRVPDCFWSDTDQCWLFEDWDGAHYTNVAVTDPQAWMWVPKAPEGL